MAWKASLRRPRSLPWAGNRAARGRERWQTTTNHPHSTKGSAAKCGAQHGAPAAALEHELFPPHASTPLYDGRERRRRIIEDEGKKQCEEEIVCDVLRLLYLNLQRLKRPLYRPKSQLQF